MAKFKIGERARIIDSGDIKPNVAHLVGRQCTVTAEVSDTYGVLGSNATVYNVDVDSFGELIIAEFSLRRALPDSDTYRPADISIDDLMRSVKQPELCE